MRARRLGVWRSDEGSGDEGMATAEYAVGTVAACGFGTVLYQILTSDAISKVVSSLIEKALSLVFG